MYYDKMTLGDLISAYQEAQSRVEEEPIIAAIDRGWPRLSTTGDRPVDSAVDSAPTLTIPDDARTYAAVAGACDSWSPSTGISRSQYVMDALRDLAKS